MYMSPVPNLMDVMDQNLCNESDNSTHAALCQLELYSCSLADRVLILIYFSIMLNMNVVGSDCS